MRNSRWVRLLAYVTGSVNQACAESGVAFFEHGGQALPSAAVDPDVSIRRALKLRFEIDRDEAGPGIVRPRVASSGVRYPVNVLKKLLVEFLQLSRHRASLSRH